jgi:LPS-assembly protein
MAVLIAVLMAGTAYGFSIDVRTAPLDMDTATPTRVTASEEIIYDEYADEVTAKGDVTAEREGLRLSADTIRIYPSAQTAVADGNIQVTSGEDFFSGSRLEIDWGRESGTFYDGTLFLKENHFFVRAEEITKVDADTYTAEDVSITTCDGESPTWRIEGKKLDVTYEGYGYVNHAFFKLKAVPLIYSPFLVFPMKTKRQSGLLTPRISFSDKKGTQFSQPYYWAINDSMDATLYADYMSSRGIKMGGEYRYFLSEDDKGVVMFDFFEDRKVDDGTGTSTRDWGYGDDRYLRPNSDRYWFRMKHDQTFGERAGLMFDFDIVSDQDYLEDFSGGYSGFDDSWYLFDSVFNRVMDNYNDPVRKNRINFNVRRPGYGLNIEALWWDNVIARRYLDTDETVQSLPVIYFDRYKQPLFSLPIYVAFETQSAYLFRKDGSRGGRIDLYPRIYLPYRFGRMLSVEPSLGGRETFWQLDDLGDGDLDLERTQHRELYDFQLDLSSEIENVFQRKWGNVDGLKHAVKFLVEYDYTPTLEQEELPYFDGLDRIEDENLVSYTVVNTVTTRSGEKDAYSYKQGLRFELSQSYDVGRQRDGDSKPFNPVEADLQLDLGKWCNLQGDAAWSPYTNEFTSHNLTYKFRDSRGDALYLQHRYTESLYESAKAALKMRLTDRIWLFADYERNLITNKDIGRSLDAVYRAQCWSVEARYEEETENTSLSFVFTFYGLGEVGAQSEHSEGLPSWADNGF